MARLVIIRLAGRHYPASVTYTDPVQIRDEGSPLWRRNATEECCGSNTSRLTLLFLSVALCGALSLQLGDGTVFDLDSLKINQCNSLFVDQMTTSAFILFQAEQLFCSVYSKDATALI